MNAIRSVILAVGVGMVVMSTNTYPAWGSLGQLFCGVILIGIAVYDKEEE